MNCSIPGIPVLHSLPKFAQTHVHWVSDAIQPSHPLLALSPPALNLSQHQCLSQCVGSSHQVAKVLELQHQSFQWKLISFRIDWFNLLAVQGTLKRLLQHHTSKVSILWHLVFFMIQFQKGIKLAFIKSIPLDKVVYRKDKKQQINRFSAEAW